MKILSNPILFSYQLWKQIQAISLPEQKNFLRIIKEIIRQTVFDNPIEKFIENNLNSFLLITLLFTEKYQLIFSVVDYNSKGKAIKIIGFQKISSDLNLEETLAEKIKIENLNKIDTEIKLEESLIANYLVSHNNNFIINHDSFKIQMNDFYSYSCPQSKQILPILLSAEQYKLITNQPQLPILLTGNKGTGKTTLAIAQAFNQEQINLDKNKYQILYVTPNQRLNKQVSQIINDFGTNKIRSQEYQTVCRFIGQKYGIIANNDFLAQRKITFRKFLDQFYQPKKIFLLKPEDLWQEIQKVIKGSIKALSSEIGLISLSDYLANQNQSILPKDTNFKAVYSLATQYQKWLKLENYWDDLDLTQFLLNHMTEHYQGDYQQIYIDEIQDFSEIQIQLLFRLLTIETNNNYLPKFFLINTPELELNSQSQFSWHKIKKNIVDLYHKLPQWSKIRSVIEPIKSLNYRFTQDTNITNLSSAIASLNYSSLKTEKKANLELLWLSSNQKPMIISGSKTEIIEGKNRLAIDSTIIVFNKQDKKELAQNFPLDNCRILTLPETKGLQFKQVLVWQLLTYLEQLRNQNSLDLEEYKKLKYNHLYFCSNLAEEKLYFYDENINEFWNLSTINPLIEIGYPTDLESLFEETINTQKISKQGEKYLQLGTTKAYEIANQIYSQADDAVGLAKVKAIQEEEAGNLGNAGDIWHKLNVFDEAIRCWNEVDKRLWLAKWANLNPEDWSKRGLYFENKQNYNLAELCYEKADDWQGKLRCLEATNRWELAGDKCKSLNQLTEANKYYQLADQYYQENKQIKNAIQMWTKLNKWDRIAQLWQKIGKWEKAAFCWQKEEEMEKAGECWEKVERWQEAEKCWLNLEKWDKLAQCYETQGEWQKAAQTWQKQGELVQAGFCFQRANQWDKAELIWRELNYWGLVAVALQQQQKWELAVQAWAKANTLEQQALCYEQMENWEKAEEMWLKAENWERAIIIAEKQDKWLEVAESWESLGKWDKSAEAWMKLGEKEKAGECYELAQMWTNAENIWRELGEKVNLAKNLFAQKRYVESAQIWQELANWQEAGKAWRCVGEIAKAGECYEKAENWREAEDCWRWLQDWERVDLACIKQGKWQKAAHDWLMKNQLDQAALCYEKCRDWQRAAQYWQKSGNWDKSAYAYTQIQKWDEAGKCYLQTGKTEDIEKAGLCYERAENWQKAEECWRKIWQWEKLAVLCEKQQNWNEAAKSWRLLREMEKAGECYEKAENWQKAEECWREGENWLKLALVCEKQQKWEESAQLWTFLTEWEKAANACLQMNDLETAIKYYEKANLPEKANYYRQKLLENS